MHKALAFLSVIPSGNLLLPLPLPLLLLLPLPLPLPLFLQLFVFRRHPERSEGPPHWLLPLPFLHSLRKSAVCHDASEVHDSKWHGFSRAINTKRAARL
jgi:hypothetical protein